MQVGVTVRLSGTLTYYETGQVFQITDIVDKLLTSKVDNIKVIEEYKEPVPTVITGADIVTSDKNLKFNYVKLENLQVTNVYTTTNDQSSSKGAMTITCKDANGNTVTIRTDVLFDKTGQFTVDKDYKVVQSNFEGKTISVLGVVEMYEGAYQIKVVSPYDITIN
jgi:DNA/RNA endonuclease YhcR with UshA esterase domain